MVYTKTVDSVFRALFVCTNTRKELRRCVRQLGTIIQSIFCAQSEAGIRLNFWKWSGESRYPGTLPPLLENFRPAFSPNPTGCPWVSEDGVSCEQNAFLVCCRNKQRNFPHNQASCSRNTPKKVTKFSWEVLTGKALFL